MALPPPFANAVGEPPLLCGTLDPAAEAALRFRPRRVLDDNIPLWFDQDPVLLTADYRGTVTLANFVVSGDVASIQFNPVGGGPTETWSRVTLAQIGSRTVSVFAPSWNQQQVSVAYKSQEVGLDSPYLYWGEVLPPGIVRGSGYSVYVRVLSNSIPQVSVVQVADDVQYSSTVVNIRSDDFGATQLLDDENSYGLEKLTKRFYDFFDDAYDSIGITTASTRLPSPTGAGFYFRVRNDVKGIGQVLFNNSVFYGSSGRLSGVEFYTGATMTSNRALAHETTHRWASYIDWAKLAGITLAGIYPTAHDPLMTGGETRMGAVLEGTRRVAGVNGAWTIQRTPAPILFHPYTLYAMGILSPEEVPEVALFDDQGQFNKTSTATPRVGTTVSGDARTATISSVIGMLGPRDGPAPTTWDQALIVVSSGRLLSRREMDYWTFYAQRTADPNRTGVMTWNGYGSFDAATSWRVDLRHDIRPRGGTPIREPLPVDTLPLAPSDFRDIQPDEPVHTLYDVGERFHMTGRISATDHDFNYITIDLYRDPGGGGNEIVRGTAVSSNDSFDVAMPTFTANHRGQWIVLVYLYWPGASSQDLRLELGTLTVR